VWISGGGALNKRIVIFLALFLVHGATAEAGSWVEDFTPYIGIGGGGFSTKYTEQGALGGLKLSKSTWGSFLKAGLDNQRYYFAVEVRAGLTGSVSNIFPAGTIGSIRPVDLTVQTTNFISYFAKLQYPVTQKFKVYGLLGGTTGRFKVESSGGVRGSVVTWKSAFSYGAGAEYRFRSKGSIGLEWVQYWNDVPLSIVSNTTSKASMYGVSLMINKFF